MQFVLPIAFPSAQPDCFYVSRTCAWRTAACQPNSGIQSLDGQQLLWFSWHLAPVTGPRPIDSYLRLVERRSARPLRQREYGHSYRPCGQREAAVGEFGQRTVEVGPTDAAPSVTAASTALPVGANTITRALLRSS